MALPFFMAVQYITFVQGFLLVSTQRIQHFMSPFYDEDLFLKLHSYFEYSHFFFSFSHIQRLRIYKKDDIFFFIAQSWDEGWQKPYNF